MIFGDFNNVPLRSASWWKLQKVPNFDQGGTKYIFVAFCTTIVDRPTSYFNETNFRTVYIFIPNVVKSWFRWSQWHLLIDICQPGPITLANDTTITMLTSISTHSHYYVNSWLIVDCVIGTHCNDSNKS